MCSCFGRVYFFLSSPSVRATVTVHTFNFFFVYSSVVLPIRALGSYLPNSLNYYRTSRAEKGQTHVDAFFPLPNFFERSYSHCLKPFVATKRVDLKKNAIYAKCSNSIWRWKQQMHINT